MNEPADVPTYTSKLFTVLFTASRSSARSAPISYTPPVNPPPPRTSAVLWRRARALAAERGRTGPPTSRGRGRARSFPPGSSLTTLPIGRPFYGLLPVLIAVLCALG